MDKRDFIVIENEKVKEPAKTLAHQTNPIAKKFIKFQNEKEKFSVKELFKQ